MCLHVHRSVEHLLAIDAFDEAVCIYVCVCVCVRMRSNVCVYVCRVMYVFA
jgi:hypothetical protein